MKAIITTPERLHGSKSGDTEAKSLTDQRRLVRDHNTAGLAPRAVGPVMLHDPLTGTADNLKAHPQGGYEARLKAAHLIQQPSKGRNHQWPFFLQSAPRTVNHQRAARAAAAHVASPTNTDDVTTKPGPVPGEEGAMFRVSTDPPGWLTRGRKRDSPLNQPVRATKIQPQGFPPAPELLSSAALELEEGKGRLDVWPATMITINEI